MPVSSAVSEKEAPDIHPESPRDNAGTAPGLSDFAPGLERAFPDEFPEADCTIESIEGEVPDFIRGTYYLNGPARFRSHGLSYRHWLDGDGMVCSLGFEKSKVRFRNRYVRSTKFAAEQEAGRPLFRAFGTSFEGSRLNSLNNGLESPVNVSVYPFSNRLLAFGEQGLPWELDPETLETRGQYTFNGRLNDASPFSAHPKFDPESGEMFNFGIFFSQTPRLYFYCFGPGGLRYRKSANLDFGCSVHDFSISKHYAVFYLSPYLLDINAVLQGQHTVMDSLHWEPGRGSRLLVLNRKNGETAASIPIGSQYCLHLINSFEHDGHFFVDLLEFDEPIYPQYEPVPDMFQMAPAGYPVRLVIDLKKQELITRQPLTYCCSPDFPALNPRHAMECYDDFWMLGISSTGGYGRKFFDQLVHANWQENTANDIYQAPAMQYLAGEPAFIADPASETGGAIICQCFNADTGKNSFLIFEAQHVFKGPVAVLNVDQPVRLGFHAVFVPVSE